ncbi:hypothetical protein [Flavobacterium daejeonense]|uniref:hypothetical protein n=1 Tax=Flavobacterium daejeonense TaxID=350893 RepID=UPI00047BDBB3|nr:hypothetical protein [Flavobacterium daejeonense]
MILIPRFDIIPHGVKLNGNTYEAVFKVSVSVRQFEKSYVFRDSNFKVSTEDFSDFIRSINNYQFNLLYESGKVKLYVRPRPSETDPADQSHRLEGYFNFANVVKTNTPTVDGQRRAHTTESSPLGMLAPLETKVFKIRTEGEEIPLFQIDGDLINTDGKASHYNSILQSNKKYAKFREQQDSLRRKEEEPLDFRVVYANIMNEPLLAEQHFGIVREFNLDADKMLGSTDDLSYQVEVITEIPAIKIPDIELSIAKYRLLKKEGKYYNGLKKVFFSKSDFKEVVPTFHDLYKAYLEKKQPHPDGIYLNVLYGPKKNEKGEEIPGELHDPFDDPGIKGYNAVVFSDSYRSLSFHKIEYIFTNQKKYYEYTTSGTLMARSEIITQDDAGRTPEKKAYRNNVLLAWRGDNLLVNRNANAKLEETESKNQNKPKMEVGTEYRAATTECEDVFINQEFFSITESLLNDTQTQLIAGRDYYFLLRTVSYLEHYMPIAAEIAGKPEQKYTMTVEDYISSQVELEKHTITTKPVTPYFHSATELPIKSVDIIGKKKFGDKNTGFVDNGNHIVLNRIDNEKKEKRFIYPPSIKLEDIRILGYQSPELIKMEGEAQLTRDEFVYRCIRMEKRNANTLPERANRRTTVDYLADPRGKKLLFVPNDLYTLLQLPKTQFKEVYEFSKRYPFYDDTESSKLELRFSKGTNSSQLLLNDEVLYSHIPQGIFNFNIYVADKAFGIDEIKRYNSTPLKISCVDKPKVPEISIVPNFAFEASRNPAKDPAKNYWFLPIEMDESNTWKSLKYIEETTVLNLNQSDYSKLLKRKLRKGMSSYDLMFDEYPYETFLTTEGNVDYKGELRTSIFPEKVKISLMASQSLKLADDSIFMSLMLNDKEKLIVRSSGSELCLYMNDVFLGEQAEQFELQIVFNRDENCFDIMRGEKKIRSLTNYINPDISVKDIEISQEILHLLYQHGSNCKINLERAGSYIFVTDNRHPYSAKKRVKLFASSPYQAYFPKVESEFSLGTTGSVFDITIPNNTRPLKPVIEADVLLMYTKDESWHDKEIKKFKKTKTQSLVRITMDADFMMEGHNKLGIIIRNIVRDNQNIILDPTFGKVSLIGDDITKLSKTDFTNQTLKNMLDNTDLDKPLFKKYLADEAIQNYHIEGQDYEVLLCTPFYNSLIRKWQVILPLGNFIEAESMFVKLSCVKISEGHGFDIVQGQNVTVQRDLTGTNLSPITDPIIFPIYSPREISIQCQKDTYRIQYNGPVSNKLFFVIYINDDDGVSTIMDKNGTKNFVSFSCPAANDPQENGRILLFSQTDIIISKKNASKLLVLEFETHDNFKLQDFKALQNFKGKISDAPVFVAENPMFDIDGIRLINAAEFKL